MEICDGNLINEIDVESIIEAEYPDVAVLMNECLSFCGLCAIKPYAMVNGTRVFANTPEEALEKIRTKIEEELAFYAE
ncbi:YuzB family protein [Halobacillus sp. A1]|uniref:DUF1450 domain-containing protein n=1 Tax=Halobacillus sp. A1 TaxID=2880262 RepID=UPI0020A65ED4|nr:YuzB family protein [Halobacillus sp. A1]